MFKHTHQIRICYADTDQMGFVYYGNYARFFEIARVEAIRFLGFTYKQIEDAGCIMPVSEFRIKYLKPANYDDLISIETSIVQFPDTHKIEFMHRVFNEAKILLAKGNVCLYLLNKRQMQPSKLPDELLQNLNQYFKNS